MISQWQDGQTEPSVKEAWSVLIVLSLYLPGGKKYLQIYCPDLPMHYIYRVSQEECEILRESVP